MFARLVLCDFYSKTNILETYGVLLSHCSPKSKLLAQSIDVCLLLLCAHLSKEIR
jgi:hypothetical protein